MNPQSFLLITSLLLPIVACGKFSSLVQNVPKISTGKVFLFGGALDDDTSEIYDALREATGKERPKIAVAISAAAKLKDGLSAYYDDLPGSLSYQNLFLRYGFEPSVVELAIDNYEEANSNNTELGRANIEVIQGADVIFFNGGDQSRHSRSWFNDDGSDSDIMEALREQFSNGAIVCGTSAGAAIQSDPTYGEGYAYGYYYFNADLKSCAIGENLRDDREGNHGFRYDENGGYMEGFGFLQGVLVDTHFDARGRFGRLPIAMRATQKTYGLGVGENTALYVNEAYATVFGADGVWIMDATSAQFPPESYFAVDNFTFSYLTTGDTYDFTTKTVISTKESVSSGSGNVYESDQVFDNDEGIRSVKSLVDSDAAQSVGYSYESDPTARVVFYKGQGEKLYKSGSLYTVDKMRMDIGTLRKR